VRPGRRDAFLAASMAVTAARRSPGCLEFVVAADPIEPDRSVVMGDSWMAYLKAMGSPLTAQLTPKRSVSMPKVLAQNAGASGIVT
jgi:hypothetical protein